MIDEDKIRDAVDVVHKARIAYENMQMMNVQRDPVKAIKQSQDYAIAQAKYFAANSELEKIIKNGSKAPMTQPERDAMPDCDKPEFKYGRARPTLTSVMPRCADGQEVVTALCEICGTIKAFTGAASEFPDSGYWTECRACQSWTMFYLVRGGHIRRKYSGDTGKHYEARTLAPDQTARIERLEAALRDCIAGLGSQPGYLSALAIKQARAALEE
jgi:hypothetical protein